MADDIIGSLGVQIEADASDLKGQYDEAVAQSEAAAERIAGAFESLVGIGEALAITEGLKEFGQEALNAYGTVQSVTIGLTQLTKSASDANDIIEQVKNLAATEPFAFPEIAPTVQKMVALGVEAEQIPAVMQAVADASAATGNSFQAVANSFDRMTLSGTVNARTLVQLGVSTQDLGRAMGVTADEVKTAFAALDQSERIDVLNTALEKFAGSAKAQAQGIAGQWQIFQNQFEEVMVGVGEALTPAITAILAFGKDALGAVQTVVDAFNALPEPVKEAAGVLAIAVAAIAPLTVAAGTLGLGIVGVKAALEPLNELLIALGLRSGEAAIAQEAQAVAASHAAIAEGEAATATAAAGEAAGGAVFGFAAMDTAVAGASLALGALVGWKVGEWAVQNIPGVDAFGKAMANLYTNTLDAIAGQKGFTDGMVLLASGLLGKVNQANLDLSNSTFLLSQKLGELGVVIPRGTLSLEEWRQKLVDASLAYQKTNEAATGYGAGLDSVIAKQEKLNAAEQQAAANLIQAKQAYADGAVSLDILNAAQDAYDKAVTAATAHSANFKDTLAGVTDAYNKQQSQIATLQQTVMQLMAAQDGSVAMSEKLNAAEAKLEAAYKAVDTAAKNTSITIQDTGEHYNQAATAAEALEQKQRNLIVAVQQAKAVLDEMNASTDTSATHQRAVTDAVNQYVTALKNSGAAMSDTITINVNGVQVMTTLGDAVNQLKAAHQQLQTTMENGVSVIRMHEQEQSTLSDILARQPALLTNLSSQYFNADTAARAMVDSQSNLNREMTNAQAVVNDLQSRLAAGNLTTQQAADVSRALATELKTLIGIEQQLGTSVGASTDQIAQQTAELNNLTNAAGTAKGAMDSLGGSFQATTSAVDAMGVGISFLAMQMSGLTVFAGSGGLIDTNQDPGDLQHQLQLAQNQAAGGKLVQGQYQMVQATTSLTTAVQTVHAAVATATPAVTNLATATTSLSTAAASTTNALGNVTTAYTDVTASSQTFVDALGNVYNSYQALVDAIRNNPLLAGAAQSQSGSGNPGSGPSAAPQSQYKDALGNLYSSYDALQAAIAKDPLLAGAAQSSTNAMPQTLFSDPTGRFGNVTSSGGDTLGSAIAKLFPGGGSGGMGIVSAVAQPTPGWSGGTSFGSSPLGSQTTPITINMNYPQFANPAAAQKTMADIVTMLRTVPSLKL